MNAPVRIIKPQAGPQEAFLSSSADIAIYEGGAGGGKTWALLLEPLRHMNNKRFGAVFFRRNTVQVRNKGGLWDASMGLYPYVGASPRESVLKWAFPSGASIDFAHLEHEKTVLDWQGSEIPLLCFDELTHFSESQFFYMVSRNRSTCGVRPYIRASCNPDPDSWVASFLSWWIDQETGFPIMERAGKIRYMVRVGNSIVWADRPEDLADHVMPDPDDPDSGRMVPIPAKSVTFIPSLVTDNRELLKVDPGYLANLMSLSTVQRERLMKGNWKIRASEGMVTRDMFQLVDVAPRCLMKVRGWDLAATKVDGEGRLTRAATAGVLMGITVDGRYVIEDAQRKWLGSNEVVTFMKRVAKQDGVGVVGDGPQDPGAAGKAWANSLMRHLAGYNYSFTPETGSKEVRAEPLVAQIQAGNVLMVRGEWNKDYTDEWEGFPSSGLKDQVDASSRAFARLISSPNYVVAL